ncbi:MAG: restriction endonuclease subunit S [Pirellula sp.]|jgi:type I restriction enzyme S subunit|nr:restriction endonuclease subunit S [Pirellula sp.]
MFTLGQACTITTGELDANAATHGGKYPFFTCAQFPLQIDNYAFDDSVILIAGNNAQGNFHVTRYTGKFNAYQRTYILTAKDGFDLDYIFYALKLLLKRLKDRAQGSQTKFLTIGLLNDLEFEERPPQTQTAIAKVLRSIDDKISVNNQINQQLQDFASLLYKYWLVQFDFPFSSAHADSVSQSVLKGKPYRSSGGKLTYNKVLKREIPIGWGHCQLGEICDCLRNTIDPTSIDSETPYVGLEHVPRRKFFLNDWGVAGSVTSLKNAFASGDFLFGKLRPYFHKVVRVSMDGVCSSELLVLRAKKKVYEGLIGSLVFSDLFVESSSRQWGGAQMPRADWKRMETFVLPLPPEEILLEFNANILPLWELGCECQSQNIQLAQIRDWLLPMLINGQVRVGSVEKRSRM